MDKHSWIAFLHKYRKGDLTIEEQHLLISYYNLFQNEPDVTEELSTAEKNELKDGLKENIWRNILSKEKGRRTFINTRVKVSVAAAVFLGFSFSLFSLLTTSTKRQAPSSLAVQQPNKPTKRQDAAVPAVQTKENRVLFLPDGSTVTLSPGSKLNYPSSFDGMSKREVYLYGQAFFDVKRNVSRPFVVHTGKLQTIVLGTSFNIKAMPDEKDIVVTVKSGKVQVNVQDKPIGVISPNQQMTYDLRNVRSFTKVLDSDSYLAWKEQDLFLDNLTVAEAAQLLEERYNVEIVIKDQSLGSQRFTTTFKKNENFEEVLKSICVFNGVVYEYNKEKTVVTLSNNFDNIN